MPLLPNYNRAYEQLKEIDRRLSELRIVMDYNYSEIETAALLEEIRARVLAVHDFEQAAVRQLQAIMAG